MSPRFRCWGTHRWGMAVVRGRSMSPTLQDGDRLVIDHAGTPRAGRIAVIRLPDGVIAIKRLTTSDADGWWVTRDNPFEGVDSWSVGVIRHGDVLAIARCRIWPRPGRLPGPPGGG